MKHFYLIRIFNYSTLQYYKSFFTKNERTLKIENKFLTSIFLISLKYEHRKGLYQADFLTETQAR
jgi:hypothetical protein